MLLFAAAHSLGAECQECHPRESAEHAGSAHAKALQPVFDSRFFKSLSDRPIGEARGGFLLTYEKRDKYIEVTAARGQETASANIAWVFGAGRRAETPIVLRGSTTREHRISYYANGGRFDLTMGHAGGISRSAEAALGIVQAPEVVQRCFGCHSAGGLPGASSFRAGVQCENCHAGAQEHARSGTHVSNPASLKPNALVAFCAACHRGSPEGNEDDPINVRYQTVRLVRSKCFLSGKLSCLTCHDAHSDAAQSTAAYQSRCLACHADQQGRGDCVSCHMARVAINSRLTFTDHYIRVLSGQTR